jgi:hypothetical protein
MAEDKADFGVFGEFSVFGVPNCKVNHRDSVYGFGTNE